MAFTRKFLAALGIEADKIDQIMEAHVDVTDALKAQITEAADSRDELDKVKDQLRQAKESLKATKDQLTAAEKERDDYKSKSETSAAEFEKLKTETSAKETAARREAALRAELRAKKYSDEAASIIFDSKRDFAAKVELGEDGTATNLSKIMDEIESAYPQYKPQSTTNSSQPATPPANGGGKPAITKEEIMAIKNTAERQKKIAENPDLFGIK